MPTMADWPLVGRACSATGSRIVLVYLLGTGPGAYTGAAGQLSLNVT
jgi:hypothetical protein